ncbi:MAG: N-acetylmuramoyl-L-alanine amidase [Firmicutes bacterium]|nr:N-acetylmuramoyl-L-alanine amidase [Bacillota bacterium]
MLIVLDAGHGGYDAGAVNGNRQEKDDNLRMTLAIGRTLQSCGVNVLYTRDTDVFIPLMDRSRISNNAGADYFVSIHRNSSTSPQANGFEVHTYTTPTAESMRLAQNILQAAVTAGVQSNRGIKQSNLSVLRNTTAPAVLVEANFISNAMDNQLFDNYFEQMVQNIADGILKTAGVSCDGTGGLPGGGGNPGGGSTNIDTIRNIQKVLNQRYGTGLVVDGIWGPASRRALIRGLQTELNRLGANLVVDGVWGPRTRAAIPLLRRGSTGNLVYLMQCALYVKGYTVALDGIFGADTERAVRQFQQDHRLGADGIAGPATMEKLFT